MRVFYTKAKAGHPDSVECDGFKELDEGLQLYNVDDSTSGKEIIGYMPHGRVTYILPHED